MRHSPTAVSKEQMTRQSHLLCKAKVKQLPPEIFRGGYSLISLNMHLFLNGMQAGVLYLKQGVKFHYLVF